MSEYTTQTGTTWESLGRQSLTAGFAEEALELLEKASPGCGNNGVQSLGSGCGGGGGGMLAAHAGIQDCDSDIYCEGK